MGSISLSGDGIAEWKQGWPLVMASTIGFAVALMHIYSLGIMMEPLQAEFGWTRAQVSSGMMIYSGTTVVLAPFAGMLVDRWGPRRVAITGTISYLIAFAAFSTVQSSLWMWWGLWLLLGFCAVMTKPATWATAVSSRFFKQRALALAILFCAAGLGSATVPSITHALVQNVGWRSGFVGLSLLGALIALPALWFFLFDGRTKPFRHSGATAGQPSANAYTGLSVREALRSSRFARLAITGALMSGLTISLTVHFVPILISIGFSRSGAAATTGLLGLGAIFGHIFAGVVLDRYNGPRVGAACFMVPIPGVLILLSNDPSVGLVSLAAFCLGLGIGSQGGALAYLATRYFGVKNFGTIYGTYTAVTATGAAWPMLVGHIYDKTGSYQPVLQAAAPLYLLCAIMVLTLGAYPIFRTEEAAPA